MEDFIRDDPTQPKARAQPNPIKVVDQTQPKCATYSSSIQPTQPKSVRPTQPNPTQENCSSLKVHCWSTADGERSSVRIPLLDINQGCASLFSPPSSSRRRTGTLRRPHRTLRSSSRKHPPTPSARPPPHPFTAHVRCAAVSNDQPDPATCFG